MISIHDKLYADFEAVNSISIVPMMLDVICRATGMGFAAIARVTEDRWLACSVRDEVNFGLAAGNALTFSKKDTPPVINIYARDLEPDEVKDPVLAKSGLRYCELVIEDNGTGIEQKQLKKVYDLFVRGTAKRVSDGLGTGLTHCRKIVYNHGGTMTARSVPRAGTAFSIMLPVEDAELLVFRSPEEAIHLPL